MAKGIVIVNEDWCKGCGICADVCPKGVLKLDKLRLKMQVEKPDDCIACGQCEMICPDFCIFVFSEEEYSQIAQAQ